VAVSYHSSETFAEYENFEDGCQSLVAVKLVAGDVVCSLFASTNTRTGGCFIGSILNSRKKRYKELM
jgi:hypothetical protein